MARYRKRSIVSPIGLVAIVIALYSHQLVDWKPEQTRLFSTESRLEQVGEFLASKPKTPFDDDTEEQSPIQDQLITKDSQDITPTSDSITLSGWVGTEFGENIAGVTVVLFSSYRRAHHSIITSSSGEYFFADLKPSWDYVLKASPQGKFKRYKKYPIKLEYDQEVHNIVLESIPLGLLTGRMVDPYGRPVNDIELFIKSMEIDLWATNVLTDVSGNFSVAEFPKGRFELTTKGQQSLRAIGLTFDPEASEPVSLTIDVGPYNLIGQIYDESGQTFNGAKVFLNWGIKENGIRIRSTRQVSADAGGKFRFTGLGPGDHELVVSASWNDAFGQTNKHTLRQMVNVSVDSEELNIFFKTL